MFTSIKSQAPEDLMEDRSALEKPGGRVIFHGACILCLIMCLLVCVVVVGLQGPPGLPGLPVSDSGVNSELTPVCNI